MAIIIYSILIGTIAGWVAGFIIKKEYLCLRNSILGIISFWLSISLRLVDVSYASVVTCILVTIPIACFIIWLTGKLADRYRKK